MKIVVVGSGYVGLVTGACFAESGVSVTCVDVDAEKIQNLKNGSLFPFMNPDLKIW
jgi:UDPglucose 6-dehydrogenase